MNSENNNNNILYMGKGIDKNKYKTKPKIQRGGDNEFTSTATNITSRIGKIGYDIRIFSFLAVMGILIRMIFAEKSKDYATATMYGYSASLLALLGLLVTSVGMTYKQPNTNSHLGFIKVILKTAMPVILLGIIIGIILYQNITFYKDINEGHISTEYYTWSSLSSFFILLQVGVVIYYLMDTLTMDKVGDDTSSTGLLATITSELTSLVLILTIINLGFTGILQVILKFFSTDG